MKAEIHPEYKQARVVCACGNEIETRSTVEEIHVEICSSCHPFFTGKQKLVDTAGRVEKFRAKYGLSQEESEETGEAESEVEVPGAATVEGTVPAAEEAEAALKERATEEDAEASAKAEAIQEAQEALAAEREEAEEGEEGEESEEAEEAEETEEARSEA